jgi:prepilin-type N-terminal cleavage/methylation domain-containing protein
MDRSGQPRFTQRGRGATSPFPARQGGFTLVEMAVVLVIIGVILGAVMIGRDAQRNADYLKIRQTFINQWAMAYNAYIQRAGVPPGDNVAAPTLMVGGAKAGAEAGAALCQGAAPAEAAAIVDENMLQTFRDMGVQLPNGRGAGAEDRYVYLDTNGNPVQLQVCFQFNPAGTASGAGNVMMIFGLVPDLARSLDSAIDGVVLANAGRFREALADDTAPAATWSVNSDETAVGAAANDHSAIALMNAHYKMNQ